jgi:hypothetical protein
MWSCSCFFQGDQKKKPKYVYKTAEELIATGPTKRRQAPEVQSDLAKVKVIDMTGKEQRVLSGTLLAALPFDHELLCD